MAHCGFPGLCKTLNFLLFPSLQPFFGSSTVSNFFLFLCRVSLWYHPCLLRVFTCIQLSQMHAVLTGRRGDSGITQKGCTAVLLSLRLQYVSCLTQSGCSLEGLDSSSIVHQIRSRAKYRAFFVSVSPLQCHVENINYLVLVTVGNKS